jgi:hybrid cluster-associated redox disulfide protein
MTEQAAPTIDPKNPIVSHTSNLGEVVFRFPEAAEILTDYGLHCVGCFASSFDTIADAAKIHDMSDEEIGEMIDRVNEVIQHKE